MQEEVGLRGAHTSAYGIDPDMGICVEVTFATDHPGADKKTVGDVQLGKGPVLSRGANINPKVFELLRDTAKKAKIPLPVRGGAPRHGHRRQRHAAQPQPAWPRRWWRSRFATCTPRRK